MRKGSYHQSNGRCVEDIIGVLIYIMGIIYNANNPSTNEYLFLPTVPHAAMYCRYGAPNPFEFSTALISFSSKTALVEY